MLEVIRRLHIALPQVREWICQYIEAHAPDARPVRSLGFPRLAAHFPDELLESTKVVSVDRVQFPPASKFGLPEFDQMQQISFAGITFKDTFFIQRGQESETLHFHELVHIVQWARLGVDNFLFAYALGLLQFGYEQSPLEAMAYTLQRQFEAGTAPNGLVPVIEQSTDAIWNAVAPIVRAALR